MKKKVTYTVDAETIEKLDELVKQLGKSKTQIVTAAVREYRIWLDRSVATEDRGKL